MKHTSGFWVWEFHSGQYEVVQRTNTANPRLICEIPFRGNKNWTDTYPPAPEAEANARLIAAAPEILKAAKAALSELRTNIALPWVDDLRNAVKKAEGE